MRQLYVAAGMMRLTMKFMVIDGNSILNRAFYGVRLLTNHDGLPTNYLRLFVDSVPLTG